MVSVTVVDLALCESSIYMLLFAVTTYQVKGIEESSFLPLHLNHHVLSERDASSFQVTVFSA